MPSPLLASVTALALTAAPATPPSPRPFPADAAETHLVALRQVTLGEDNPEDMRQSRDLLGAVPDHAEHPKGGTGVEAPAR